MDEKALTDFGLLTPERTTVRLLADKNGVQDSLPPAVERWTPQYGDKRPLEAKLTPRRALHDRAIFVDGKGAWVLTQSLKDFATRAPGVIFRVDEAACLRGPLDLRQSALRGRPTRSAAAPSASAHLFAG